MSSNKPPVSEERVLLEMIRQDLHTMINDPRLTPEQTRIIQPFINKYYTRSEELRKLENAKVEEGSLLPIQTIILPFTGVFLGVPYVVNGFEGRVSLQVSMQTARTYNLLISRNKDEAYVIHDFVVSKVNGIIKNVIQEHLKGDF